jgi:hypothetical protein
MGAYYMVVNAAKRQCIDIGLLENDKNSGLMLGWHARALALFLCDERRRGDWPLSLVGSWAGDPVFFPHDEEDGPVTWRDEQNYVLPYGIETRTQTNPDRTLYYMARDEFEEVTGAMIALFCEFDPSLVDQVPRLVDRLSGIDYCNTSRQVAALRQILTRKGRGAAGPIPRGFSASERFLLAQPATRTYLNPVLLGDDPTVFGLLRGLARFLSRGLLLGSRGEPVYSAGERSAPNPTGVITAASACPRRNLYGMALAEYEDVTYREIPDGDDILSREFRSDLVSNAVNNDGLLLELGNAVDAGGLAFLEADLITQLGPRWRMRLEPAYRKRHPPVPPSWLQYNDRLAEKIAWAITLEDRYDDLGILADALEGAGCNNADILQHCRSPWEHARKCARGCWVVDALLQ